MTTHVLRVEGVNFAATMDDTQNLSCNRGASLALSQAVKTVKESLSLSDCGATLVFSGASAMAFTLTIPSRLKGDEEGEKAWKKATLDTVHKALSETGRNPQDVRENHTPPLAHLSFVASMEPIGTDDGVALARAEARNRAAQFRQLTVVLPPWPEQPAETKPAEAVDRLNRVLPADTPVWMPGNDPIAPTREEEDEALSSPQAKPEQLSASVAARLHYGRRMRQTFYEGELGKDDYFANLRFTDSLTDLCAYPPAGVPEGIRNKIAVLYVDGNKFGRIRKSMSGGAPVVSIEALNTFSDQLRSHQKGLLHSLLDTLDKVRENTDEDTRRHAWVWSPEEKRQRLALRLETLLWGGDEMMWAVPAWLAFWLAEAFFTLSDGWAIEYAGQTHTLTHGAGMVICDRKTPIRQAKAMAHELAERAKTTLEGKSDDVLQFDIFESADLPDGRLDTYRGGLYPGLTGAFSSAFSLRGRTLTTFIKTIQGLKTEGDLPRSKIYGLLAGAVHDKAFGDAAKGSDLKTKLGKYLTAMGRPPTLTDGISTLWNDQGDEAKAVFPLRLAQLAQVWDYIGPFAAPERRRRQRSA